MSKPLETHDERQSAYRGPGPDSETGNDPDFTLHELGKFCGLALKGNPAVLEVLWNDDVIAIDAWGRELRERRTSFLHRDGLGVYVAYAESQLKKMARGGGLHAKGGSYNGKFGAHLIRLLHAGITLAATGEVQVRVPPADTMGQGSPAAAIASRASSRSPIARL